MCAIPEIDRQRHEVTDGRLLLMELIERATRAGTTHRRHLHRGLPFDEAFPRDLVRSVRPRSPRVGALPSPRMPITIGIGRPDREDDAPSR